MSSFMVNLFTQFINSLKLRVCLFRHTKKTTPNSGTTWGTFNSDLPLVDADIRCLAVCTHSLGRIRKSLDQTIAGLQCVM